MSLTVKAKYQARRAAWMARLGEAAAQQERAMARLPAAGDRVIEVEKNQVLFVVRVTDNPPNHLVEMAYKPDGTIAVLATKDDFKRYFRVLK